MDFRALDEVERRQLIAALRNNSEQGHALLLDRRDTTFRGTSEEIPDEEVLVAVRSVPCHY